MGRLSYEKKKTGEKTRWPEVDANLFGFDNTPYDIFYRYVFHEPGGSK